MRKQIIYVKGVAGFALDNSDFSQHSGLRKENRMMDKGKFVARCVYYFLRTPSVPFFRKSPSCFAYKYTRKKDY